MAGKDQSVRKIMQNQIRNRADAEYPLSPDKPGEHKKK